MFPLWRERAEGHRCSAVVLSGRVGFEFAVASAADVGAGPWCQGCQALSRACGELGAADSVSSEGEGTPAQQDPFPPGSVEAAGGLSASWASASSVASSRATLGSWVVGRSRGTAFPGARVPPGPEKRQPLVAAEGTLAVPLVASGCDPHSFAAFGVLGKLFWFLSSEFLPTQPLPASSRHHHLGLVT